MVEGNRLGTNAAATAGIGNTFDAFYVAGGATNSMIGGTAANAGNMIADNGGSAVAVDNAATSGTAVLGNSIFSNGGIGIDLQTTGSRRTTLAMWTPARTACRTSRC